MTKQLGPSINRSGQQLGAVDLMGLTERWELFFFSRVDRLGGEEALVRYTF